MNLVSYPSQEHFEDYQDNSSLHFPTYLGAGGYNEDIYGGLTLTDGFKSTETFKYVQIVMDLVIIHSWDQL